MTRCVFSLVLQRRRGALTTSNREEMVMGVFLDLPDKVCSGFFLISTDINHNLVR